MCIYIKQRMLTIDLDFLRKHIQQYVHEFYTLKERPADDKLEVDRETEQWLEPMLRNIISFYVVREEVSNVPGTKIYSTKKQKEDCLAIRNLNISKNLSSDKFLLDNGKAAKVSEIYSWGAAKNEIRDNVTNEFQITRKVADMGITPKIHDVFLCENLHENKMFKIVVSDFVKGMNLESWLENNPPPKDRKRVHDIVKHKLDLMHSTGIIHNAMRASNIILKMRGKQVTDAMITDFYESHDIMNKKMWDTNRLIKWDRMILSTILDKPRWNFNKDDVAKYVISRLIKENKIQVKSS